VLARHVRIFDCKVAGLLAATDDEPIFGYREGFALVVNRKRTTLRRGLCSPSRKRR
jgi:hypothetical protein